MGRLDSFHRLTMCGEIYLLVNAFQVSQWLLFFYYKEAGSGQEERWDSLDIKWYLSCPVLCWTASYSTLPCCSRTQKWLHVPSLQCFWMVIFYLHPFWNIKSSCNLGILHPWRVWVISPQLLANINIMNTSLPTDLIRQAKYWINPSTRLSSYS